jgi:hypothetical protein
MNHKIKNGIFCLEGFWYGDHRDKTSVAPLLDLIHKFHNIQVLHHRCATKEEFIYSLKRWKTKTFHNNYPILYLAFHGNKGSILVGKSEISLEEIQDILEDKCECAVIYFGSCETMDVNKTKLQNFMHKTRTLAVLGYKMEVDWVKSASFEIPLLSTLINNKFDTQGIKKTKMLILNDIKTQANKLEFRIELNERINFARKRINK